MTAKMSALVISPDPPAGAPPAAGAAPVEAAPKKVAAPAIFEALTARLAKEPGIQKEIGAPVLFKVKDVGSWLVDLSKSPATVTKGEGNATATFTLADEVLSELAGGADVRDLHQKGKLRVDGEVRLAHKLGFMKGLN